MLAHTYTSTQEAEAGELLWVQDQPRRNKGSVVKSLYVLAKEQIKIQHSHQKPLNNCS